MATGGGPFNNMDADYASRLRGLLAEGQGRITIVSGFRSAARQQSLWAKALARYGSSKAARKWVAPPGRSNHEHGQAADLGGDLRLAHALAPKYGLHFPMGHEPWHIESADFRPEQPGAYTTPPEDTMVKPPVDEHVDQLFSRLGGIFDGSAAEEVGETSTTDVGEFDPSMIKPPAAVDENNVPMVGSAGGGQMSSTKFNEEQLANAATIARVGRARGLGERAIAIAIATAMQESTLRNLNHGDRDSQGLFQQRPSQGWGTVEQVTNPEYAANKFYDSLVGIKGYETMALTQAAQKVQRSAYPDAYAKWEKQATELARQYGSQ